MPSGSLFYLGGACGMSAAWDAFLTERDQEVYGKAGFGRQAGFKDRPALLIIDVMYDFVGDRPEPILESIQRFPNSCGAEGWQAMERLIPVLEAARANNIPVIYSVFDREHSMIDQASWGAKNNRVDGWGAKINKDAEVAHYLDSLSIPDVVAPLPHEVVIRKKKPSVFFDTPLLQYLISLGVNQLLCCGTTTSGCVRATVIDAFSNNLRVAVIEDCSFDRGEASHAINLFDMQQKYADVISSQSAMNYLKQCDKNLFPEWGEKSKDFDKSSA